MELNSLGNEAGKTAQEVLGYLNFSSGAPDPRFLKNINHLFGLCDTCRARNEPAWQALAGVLESALSSLRAKEDAFRQADQVEAVLRLAFEGVLPAYRNFHRDLLFHQTEESLFQPFFLGRVCETVLQQGGPWDQAERIIADAVQSLNDHIGHRPVAVLRTQQKIQPYAHEYVRPIPIFIRGAGVAYGPYAELVERGLAILEATEPDLLFEAMFDPAMLDELAVDPRAYDFDHPVNKRPNYLFGQWDLGKLDNAGRCRRFVLQQVSLDAMVERIRQRGNVPYEEALFEEAAVLAGTMLMGSGVSGNRPDAHSSDATLATLVQQIAAYRDAFYERLLERMTGRHGERLRAESLALRQPFGGARQHFNQHLARRRAAQLQHVHLALLFARMGYTDAATRQARVVPVTSARMKCDIQCRLTTAQLEIEAARGGSGAGTSAGPRGAPAPGGTAGPRRSTGTPAAQAPLQRAAVLLEEAEEMLHRAIECGALIDPWNILGFGGQYSLFPSPENSVYDHRVDELIDLVGGIFDVYVQVQKEAAAGGNGELEQRTTGRLEALAEWWDKFASTEVSSIEGISGRETCESAERVASALRAWHEAGTAAGDLAFWRSRADEFHSPKPYAMVVDALLEQRDPVSAMALLVQWLSQAEEIPLVEENYSFHDLAMHWMRSLWEDRGEPNELDQQQRWSLARKFLDYLEANAEEYWEVPRLELAVSGGDELSDEDDEDDGDDLYSAAYEGMSYRDSTDDGFEGEMLEGGSLGGQDATDFELVIEAERIVGRLTFLATLADLWKLAAVSSACGAARGPTAAIALPGASETSAPRKPAAAPAMPGPGKPPASRDRDPVLAGWLEQAVRNRRELLDLLAAVHRYRIPPPRGTHESLVEYDRRRGVKEMLLEQIIGTCVEMGDAARVIRVVMDEHTPDAELEDWELPAEQALRAVLRGDAAGVRKVWRELIASLGRHPLLYVALARGGNPQRIVASRALQGTLRRLLAYLPRLGLLRETGQLIAAIQEMEVSHPVGPGAITEFDQMFKIACRAVVRCLVASAESWADDPAAGGDGELIAVLEQTIEGLLRSWLHHSRGVRLSVLETVSDKRPWHELKGFVERYGHDLFTQRFMNLGNIKGILHHGVDAWLQALAEEPEADEEFRLLAELDRSLPREEAVRWLTLILEAVVENYAEYVDYNSTTTQSDRGEMLYTLLDFLRLQASYDRVAWNLQPVVLAHEVIVRSGHEEAAEIWRSAVADRTASIAEEHLKRFAKLSRKYGMRLPSIADRLGERFVRPLVVDRLRALVRPSLSKPRPPASANPPAPSTDPQAAEATIKPRPPVAPPPRQTASKSKSGRASSAGPSRRSASRPATPESTDPFSRMEAGIGEFTREVSGAGFDVPSWLDALEQEVERVQVDASEDPEVPDPPFPVPHIRLSRDAIRRQVQEMTRE
jgi:hypothetical protein